MSYDSWKTTEPDSGHEPCSRCKRFEPARDSHLCEDCRDELLIEQEIEEKAAEQEEAEACGFAMQLPTWFEYEVPR